MLPFQLGADLDYCMAQTEEARRARAEHVGRMLAAGIPFQMIAQKTIEDGESLETLLGDLLSLGIRPELFVQELRSCRQWLEERGPTALQAAQTIDQATAEFEARSAAINAMFGREQVQRDYNRWLDAQLARNWVLSFAGYSGDPILRTYPGLYGA